MVPHPTSIYSAWLFCLLFTNTAFLAGQPIIPFTEEANLRGVSYLVDQLWETVPFGEGLAFVDLDDDGDDDLVLLGRAIGLVGVFENQGNGYFLDRSATSGIPNIPMTSGITAGDFDRDGDLDLYISRWQQVNHLFRNDGGFQFTDVSDQAGVKGKDSDLTTGCSWGDFNNDGYLDLAVGNRESANYLYLNQGNGSFVDMAKAQGIAQADQPAFQISFFDFDRDQDADLYISNDRGMLSCETFHNYLFENINGQFVDITDASNTHSCTDSMTVTLGDFSRNGFQDIYVTSQNLGNSLLENNGDGTFTNGTLAAGVGSFSTGWGSVFFDYNHNTFLDLYVCNMFEGNRLYRNTGSWPCDDLGPNLNIADTGESYAIASSDIDGDGDLDLALSNRGDPIRIFINHSGVFGNWIQFDVVGPGPNRWAIGANIDISHGTQQQIREVIAGSNYKSQNSLRQHFGLGSATSVDQVTVRWLGGEQRVLTQMPVNKHWKLFPSAKLGDEDGNGIWDFQDFSALLACGDMSFAPGCEVFDMDGNATLNLGDVDLFLARASQPLIDCDQDNQPDWRQIFQQPSLDLNQNGQLDLCECLADFNDDGVIDVTDLNLALPQWGSGASMADLDFNDTTDIRDFTRITMTFGQCTQ